MAATRDLVDPSVLCEIDVHETEARVPLASSAALLADREPQHTGLEHFGLRLELQFAIWEGHDLRVPRHDVRGRDLARLADTAHRILGFIAGGRDEFPLEEDARVRVRHVGARVHARAEVEGHVEALHVALAACCSMSESALADPRRITVAHN